MRQGIHLVLALDIPMDKMPLEPVVLLATVLAFVRVGMPEPNLHLPVVPHQIVIHKTLILLLV